MKFKEYKDAFSFLDKQLENSRSGIIRPELKTHILKQINSMLASDLFTRWEIDNFRSSIKNTDSSYDCSLIVRQIIRKLNEEEPSLKELDTPFKEVSEEKEKILHLLKEKGLFYITHIGSEKALLCKTKESNDTLIDISWNTYLAAPNTQIFLFLPTEAKETLFSATGIYSSYVNYAKECLGGLFTYDFAPVKIIIDSFLRARDKDFTEALEVGGYGNNLQKLRTDLDSFFFGKSITVNKELTQVIFKLKETGEELSPEDLSHGELKKLGIYVWLKYQGIENALVLMDEIEIGLHPDWQYEIANELQEWSHGNQFILATHSYELCQALTPSHVKELSPKLIK
jgi:hypothetical protein